MRRWWEKTDASTIVRPSTVEVKKGDALCFSQSFVQTVTLTGPGSYKIVDDYTRMDASGTVVATIHRADGVTTVTCPGGPPTVIPPMGCGFSSPMINLDPLLPEGNMVCDVGICTFE
jgi:hypothetical protein